MSSNRIQDTISLTWTNVLMVVRLKAGSMLWMGGFFANLARYLSEVYRDRRQDVALEMKRN